MDKVKIGDTIKIIKMDGEPQYTNRKGVITHIDDAGQIHGTWGGCALIPKIYTFVILTTTRKSLISASSLRIIHVKESGEREPTACFV